MSEGSVPAAAPAAAPSQPDVAAALARLDGLAEGTPVAEHVEVFDQVHRLLQDALATLDGA